MKRANITYLHDAYNKKAVKRTVYIPFTEDENRICTFKVTLEALEDMIALLNTRAGVDAKIEETP